MLRTLIGLVLLAFVASPALAWTRPAHMVSAAIAYEELRREHPGVLEHVLELAGAHPDRGAFEVAIGRATGEERDRRVFMEMARWPDDARGTHHDHPTWHYALRAVPDASHAAGVTGSAIEAFALNLSVARDERASRAERAIALCWLFHLVGDIHQPLHTASWISPSFAQGDHGGSLQYVIDPATRLPVTLHWYWDDRVHREAEPDAAMARARDLMKSFPRSQFTQVIAFSGPEDFSRWAQESYAIASDWVYAPPLVASPVAANAALPPASYDLRVRNTAEIRLTVSAYRLADLLRAVFPH